MLSLITYNIPIYEYRKSHEKGCKGAKTPINTEAAPSSEGCEGCDKGVISATVEIVLNGNKTSNHILCEIL